MLKYLDALTRVCHRAKIFSRTNEFTHVYVANKTVRHDAGSCWHSVLYNVLKLTIGL